MLQNYPNPFNSLTKIEFDIAIPAEVELTIFDNLGKKITTLVDEHLISGKYCIQFDASTLSSGVYIYRLTSENFTATKKLILLK